MRAARRSSAEPAPLEHFERLYRDSNDPWAYATSDYERRKYERTLDHLPRQLGDALELGCSIGVFTAMLAPRCERLTAVDFSPAALAEACRRVGSSDGVGLERRNLPEEMPEGPFEAIVCSEVLYYWTEDLVAEGLRRIESALAPGGTFLAVHWRGRDPRRALNGDDVHLILRERSSLRWVRGEAGPDYLLDLWRAG